MSNLRIVAISQACTESVNRAVYRRLTLSHGVDVHLVVPEAIVVGGTTRHSDPGDTEPFPVTFLRARGPQNRFMRLKGLVPLIRSLRPSHVLVDTTPASLVTFDAVRAVRGSKGRVWAVTYENIHRAYLAEAWQALFRGQVVHLSGALVAAWLMHSMRRKVERLFVLSTDSEHVMKQYGYGACICRMPLGYDPQLFYPYEAERVKALRRRMGLEAPTIAYFGRLIPEKGVELLLEALARNRALSWQLLIDRFAQYTSPYIDLLALRIRSLGIGDRVVSFDASHHEMPDYMNAADIVVLPSITTPRFKEQYGRVAAEAMACGKLVVGSQSGAIPEVIGDTGFSFAEGDVSALTALLATLLQSSPSETAVMRSRAAERARQELSVDRQAAIWAQMIGG